MENVRRIAFALWGFGLFWLMIALSTVVSLRLKEKMRFNMGWWGSVLEQVFIAIELIRSSFSQIHLPVRRFHHLYNSAGDRARLRNVQDPRHHF